MSPLPIQIGYAPYPQQSPNLPGVLGQIVILHQPKSRPLTPGSYRLIVGGASATKYSVHVTCSYAQLALPIVDILLMHAKTMQARLPICFKEIEDVNESIRLAERYSILVD
jgi:hypothetical protein